MNLAGTRQGRWKLVLVSLPTQLKDIFCFSVLVVFVLYLPVVSAFIVLPLSPAAIGMLSEVSAYGSAFPRAIAHPSPSSG